MNLDMNLLRFDEPVSHLTSLADSRLICIYQYEGPTDAYKIQNFFEEPFMLSIKKEDEGTVCLPDHWATA